tara:strand:- start:712 stop:864 length:153 start_codon:yes stop_codon:yes gene_type:complete
MKEKEGASVLAVGGAELREILKTLDIVAPANTCETANVALSTYFKGKQRI